MRVTKGQRIGIAVAIVLIAMLVWMVPVLIRAREQVRRSSCGNNIGNILKCCQLYAEAHDGRWPERLSQLHPGYVSDLRVFNCRCAKGPKVLTPEDIDTKSSYLYFPDRVAQESATAIVVEERHENHPGTRIVGIAAGSVEWWDEDTPQVVPENPKQ